METAENARDEGASFVYLHHSREPSLVQGCVGLSEQWPPNLTSVRGILMRGFSIEEKAPQSTRPPWVPSLSHRLRTNVTP
ncbi:hypothetical protein MHYP_G00299330 [Metynnis hypsauchen]